MQADIDGQPLTIVLLDSFAGLIISSGESNRLRTWFERGT